MPETKAPRRLFSRREAADLLRVSIATLQRLERRGRLPAIRLTPGGKVLYASEAMERLIVEPEPPAKPPIPRAVLRTR